MPPLAASLLLVFLGGGLGSVLRLLISLGLSPWQRPEGWPWATFLINILGSAVIGGLHGWWSHHDGQPLLARFLVTGLLGGFTTFSAFSLETLTLLQNGSVALALSYALASVLAGVAAAALGYALLA